ncbi:MAG: PmoA family protein [Limisphaerales bacterium]
MQFIRVCALLWLAAVTAPAATDGFLLKRCEIVPLPEHQVSLRIDGREKMRWHFGSEYSRPFFFPFNGPSGETLTRMGHPGAENHDHHRSVWFAHAKVNGLDFWSENGKTQIRQKFWYAYRDGDDEAIMASVLGWFDPEGKEIMASDLVVALQPLGRDEHALEVQLTLRPAKSAKSVTLNQSNFGLLAVRLAKTLSVHFGGGTIRNSEGAVGEPAIFGKPSRWMDYSGPVAVDKGEQRHTVVEGITYFDHPGNVNYPAKWHVREDGWMGASVCRDTDHETTQEQPLTVRYLLHAHRGAYDAQRAEATLKEFTQRPGFTIAKSKRRHRQYDVFRTPR